MSAPVEPMTAEAEARIRADVAADGGMLDGCADGALLLATIDTLRAEVAELSASPNELRATIIARKARNRALAAENDALRNAVAAAVPLRNAFSVEGCDCPQDSCSRVSAWQQFDEACRGAGFVMRPPNGSTPELARCRWWGRGSDCATESPDHPCAACTATEAL